MCAYISKYCELIDKDNGKKMIYLLEKSRACQNSLCAISREYGGIL